MTLFYLVAFVFSLSGWGLLPYGRLFKSERSPLERFIIVQTIGFTMTWLFVFLISSLQVLHPSLIHLWVTGGALSYMISWRRNNPHKGLWISDMFSGIRDYNSWLLMVLMSSMSLLAYFLFLYFAFAPTTTWDPLDYHYVMPRDWLLNGGFCNLPLLMYSNFPASVELIWMTGFVLRGDILANLFTWWFGVLAGLSLLVIAKTWFNALAGWIGLVLFLSIAIIYTEEMPGGVIDMAVFTMNLLTIYFAVKFAKDENREDLLLTILCASNGLAMKHSSLLSAVFAGAVVLYVFYRKGNTRSGLIHASLIVALAFILPLPWYIKSFVYTGNPVYPFLNGLFNPDSTLTTDIMYWSNPNFSNGPFNWITYWYNAVSDIGMVQFRFRLINGIYLGMLPFIYWAFKKPGYHRAFIWYALFIIFLLLYQAPGEPRYQLAAWGVLGVALGFGLLESNIFKDTTMRQLFPLVLIVPLTVTLVMCVHENRNKHGFIKGSDTRDEYYSKNIDIYPLIKHMNDETEEDSKIIWVDPRVLLFQRDYIPAYPCDSGTLPSWKIEALDIVEEWKEQGITHLGFTMAANYRAWVVAVILDEIEMDNVTTGYAYVEDNLAPGIKYEEGEELDFDFSPMSRDAQRLGILTPRALQLASYATKGFDYVKKNNQMCYMVDIELLQKDRAGDIDVIMMRKLIEIGNQGFLNPLIVEKTEGILFEINYAPLDWLADGGDR